MHIDPQQIVRHSADGSIDTAHYLRRGAEARSAVAWATIDALRQLLARGVSPGRKRVQTKRTIALPAE